MGVAEWAVLGDHAVSSRWGNTALAYLGVAPARPVPSRTLDIDVVYSYMPVDAQLASLYIRAAPHQPP